MDPKTDNKEQDERDNEINSNQDFNMSFDEGNQEIVNQQQEGEGDIDDENSNFLEDALKAVHHNFEAWNSLLHESNEEIPIVAEIAFSNCQEMNDIRIDLESKYVELGNLAGDLNVLYKDPEQLQMSMQTNEDEVVSQLNGP